MSNVVLGQVPEETNVRDAVHVAVISVVAPYELFPGQLVNNKAYPDKLNPVGIVDPFANRVIKEGESFWLCLFPNSVTGMVHHWSHPEFPEREAIFSKEYSERWLRNFVASHDCPDYDTVIAAATGEKIDCHDSYKKCGQSSLYYVGNNSITFIGEDSNCNVPEEFWDHVENVTGKKCPHRVSYFSCSC
jgi:hypothetical protein